MAAYYNEFDKQTAQWLRNLIAEGLIAPGDVDDRSILDVSPEDLRGYTQCHFFAGIGVWSYALRRAGWDDSRPVWTGSCPCQPFSQAGQAAGFADERHLWPYFAWLIQEREPPVVLGEQVASKAADPWIDLVHSDMEALGYAFGAVPFPSAGVGAPHQRDRTYWVADSDSKRQSRSTGLQGGREPQARTYRDSPVSRLGHPAGERLPERLGNSRVSGEAAYGDSGQASQRDGLHPSRLADAGGERLHGFDPLLQWEKSRRVAGDCLEIAGRGPVNGFWRAADWLSCRDDRWRPVEPGTFPLANGAPSRVVRLRAYGNAINAEAATQFIGAYLDGRSAEPDLDDIDSLI